MAKSHKSVKVIDTVNVVASPVIIAPKKTELMAIAKDPIQAEAFLIKAGIILKAGTLAPEYSALVESETL